MSNSIIFVLISIILAVNLVNTQGKVVICYYGSWATYRNGLGKFDVSNIDPHLCTHIVYTFVGINSKGTVISLDPYLDLPDNWGRDNFNKFNALKKQNPKLKTILAVGGWNEGSAKYSVMAANPALRTNFVQSALKMVRQYGFDGFDLDWEYPNRRDSVNGAADVDNFTQLLKELRQEFDKYNLLVTTVVSAVKDAASMSYDIPAISQYLDLIGLMTYDLNGAWDPVTGHNSPLHKGEGDENVPRENANTVDVAIEYWLEQGCPPEKLVLGLPLYGHTFQLANANVNSVRAPSDGPGISGPYTATSGLLGYNEICNKLRTESWDVHYDSLAEVPYAVQGRNWVSYDNADSLTKKVQYALSQNLGGVFVWSIETDDFNGICQPENYPLLRAVNRTIASNSSAVSSTTSSVSISTVSSTVSGSTTKSSNTPTTSAPTESTNICTEIGFAPNPSDCTSFYYCLLDTDGTFEPKLQNCPNGLYWDQKSTACNYPALVECNI